MPKRFITAILMLYGAGVPVANIRALLSHFGTKVHADTITRNIEHHSKMVEEYAKTIKPPCLGDKWSCDEKHQKVHGRESWIVAAMRAAARFVLAWDISPTKEKYDAAPCCRPPRTWRAGLPGGSLPTA